MNLLSFNGFSAQASAPKFGQKGEKKAGPKDSVPAFEESPLVFVESASQIKGRRHFLDDPFLIVRNGDKKTACTGRMLLQTLARMDEAARKGAIFSTSSNKARQQVSERLLSRLGLEGDSLEILSLVEPGRFLKKEHSCTASELAAINQPGKQKQALVDLLSAELKRAYKLDLLEFNLHYNSDEYGPSFVGDEIMDHRDRYWVEIALAEKGREALS